MFNRYHNFVAEQLASINEAGRFKQPRSDMSEEDYKKAFVLVEEDLFQTARLITCALYAKIIVNDFVRTVLNLNRTVSRW